MPALKENEYWKLRSKHGKDKDYPTPDSLLNEANNYFQFCIDNPMYETVVQKRKISRDEEIIELVEVPKKRVFTIAGLCNYLDICEKTFWNYSHNEDYIQVTTRITQIISNQKFEGAASGFFNANIIARDLGLIDKSESQQTIKHSISYEDMNEDG